MRGRGTPSAIPPESQASRMPKTGSSWASLAGRARRTQWAILFVLSAVFFVALEVLHIPAALLLGPMIGAILVRALDGTVQVALRPFQLAQGVIGCMIAQSITAPILKEIAADWPLFVGAVLAVIVASTALGLLLARFEVLPGTTAIWGASPGAASAMVLMAEAYGADFRLVAFMQYLRVVCIAITASLVARIALVGSGEVPSVEWFPQISWTGLGLTVLLVLSMVEIARLLRIPAGPLVVPMFVAVFLQDVAGFEIVLPPWFLAVSYAAVGWSIGLRFTRAILRHAARAFPSVLGSVLLLILICGGFGAVLVWLMDVDPLTAYLATSPGGADSVAIIAASSNVDVPFVMAMQMARFLIVLVTGPAIARVVVRLIAGQAQAKGEP